MNQQTCQRYRINIGSLNDFIETKPISKTVSNQNWNDEYNKVKISENTVNNHKRRINTENKVSNQSKSAIFNIRKPKRLSILSNVQQKNSQLFSLNQNTSNNNEKNHQRCIKFKNYTKFKKRDKNNDATKSLQQYFLNASKSSNKNQYQNSSGDYTSLHVLSSSKVSKKFANLDGLPISDSQQKKLKRNRHHLLYSLRSIRRKKILESQIKITEADQSIKTIGILDNFQEKIRFKKTNIAIKRKNLPIEDTQVRKGYRKTCQKSVLNQLKQQTESFSSINKIQNKTQNKVIKSQLYINVLKSDSQTKGQIGKHRQNKAFENRKKIVSLLKNRRDRFLSIYRQFEGEQNILQIKQVKNPLRLSLMLNLE